MEHDLIARAVGGDVEAYGELVGRYEQRVFNLISRMVGGRDAVADLAQEVFIKAFRNIDRFRAESSFYTWLYAIAVNTCRNFFRRQGPFMETIDGEEGSRVARLVASSETPEALAQRSERARLVRTALDGLPPEQREALVLCDLEGLEYQEIADILDIPIGTVRSRIFRARMNLKGLLPEDLRRG